MDDWIPWFNTQHEIEYLECPSCGNVYLYSHEPYKCSCGWKPGVEVEIKDGEQE